MAEAAPGHRKREIQEEKRVVLGERRIGSYKHEAWGRVGAKMVTPRCSNPWVIRRKVNTCHLLDSTDQINSMVTTKDQVKVLRPTVTWALATTIGNVIWLYQYSISIRGWGFLHENLALFGLLLIPRTRQFLKMVDMMKCPWELYET